MVPNKKTVYLFLFIFLAGCATAYTPPGDIKRIDSTEPRLRESSVLLADGETLYAVHTIREAPDPIIIGIHGLGGHANDFFHFAHFAERNSISFLAFDLRGFGHWKENRGDLKSLKVWLEDIKDVIRAVRRKHPKRAVLLMGKSLGASIALWYCSEYKKLPDSLPDGIISLSIVTRPKNQIKFINIPAGTIGYLFYPKKSIQFMPPRESSSDGPEPPGVPEIDTLKLNKVSFRLLLQSKYIIEQTPKYISQTGIPIRVFQGKNDRLSRPEDLEEIAAKMKNRDVTFLEGCNHSMDSDE
ncbi:MAG: alpha/beta fold hydrolase, partial [Thermodesulfobacteriota bacterium]